jgi:deoxyribonuclease V
LAVDVYYEENHAITAGVLFEDWQASTPVKEVVSYIEEVAPYEPGRFYKRELPCILKLIDENDLHIDSIIIDGFVFLDGHCRPGLGKHLYDVLNGRVPVVGVAKKPFKDIAADCEVIRGISHKPLYVTSVGIETDVARENVRNMHGKYRVPSLFERR